VIVQFFSDPQCICTVGQKVSCKLLLILITSHAPCPLNLCHRIGLRPQYTAPRCRVAQRCIVLRWSIVAGYNDADDASPWWRRLYDVTALLRLKRCDCKILEKVKFSKRYDMSATSCLAHVQATYDTGLRAKFRRRTSCRYKVIGDSNS